MKKIFIAGGSGYIGKNLKSFLEKRDYKVIVLSRSGGKDTIKYPENSDDLASVLNGSYALVNLAGASVAGKRWNESYKKILYNSRIDTTNYLVEAIKKCDQSPEIFVSASAVGYYGDRGSKEITEDDAPSGGLLSDICRDWEKAALKAEGVTKVFIPRIGVVLSKDDGALKQIALPFQFFIGGPFGPGDQYFPWVSLMDLLRIIEWGIENNKSGVYNAVNPGALMVRDFAKSLGKFLKRPSWIQTPSFVLKLVLGESSQEVLRSQNILPTKLKSEGFMFVDKNIDQALDRIYR